jgi:hypothetical protein
MKNGKIQNTITLTVCECSICYKIIVKFVVLSIALSGLDSILLVVREKNLNVQKVVEFNGWVLSMFGLINMIDKTMCEVLWRNISDFYVNLRVEVGKHPQVILAMYFYLEQE